MSFLGVSSLPWRSLWPTRRLAIGIHARGSIVVRVFFPLAAASSALGIPAAFADGAVPTIETIAVSNPTGESALGGSLVRGPDGSIWLSWVEPAPVKLANAPGERRMAANALRFARFDPDKRAWLHAGTVVTSQTVGVDQIDMPQLAIDGRNRMYAVWGDGSGGAYMSESADQGATWSTPVAWTHSSTDAADFSFSRLADGRLLATWLDGRDRKSRRTALYTRMVGDPETTDHLVDRSVCDCCPTSLAPLLDGSALLAYRGRTSDEVRDIRVARWRPGTGWDEPHTLNSDGWRIPGCPVNGPKLSSDGSRVAAAWFTAADAEPRVLASYSPDAGRRWLMPIRIDRGHPVGHPDVFLLRDGAIVVVWLEIDGSVWLRRIAPEFVAADPVVLAAAGTAALHGAPRILLLNDYEGGKGGARLLVAFSRHRAGTQEVTAAGVETLLVSIPEGELVMAERNCDCAPTPDELRGFPIRGYVQTVDPGQGLVALRHDEVPGVFGPGVHNFRVGSPVAASLLAGREFLARIERRGNDWWLFDPRMLAAPIP